MREEEGRERRGGRQACRGLKGSKHAAAAHKAQRGHVTGGAWRHMARLQVVRHGGGRGENGGEERERSNKARQVCMGHE